MTIDGQVSIFDLLEPETRPEPSSVPAAPAPRFVPSPDNPVHCVCCGKELTTWFDYDVNHQPMGWLAGRQMCSAMNLTLNHATAAIHQIERSLAGETVSQCCWDKHGLHGKAVRKPTLMQLADHLRWQIDRTRNTWGKREALFDEWLGAYLGDRGLLKYALDPDEYPWEFEGEA